MSLIRESWVTDETYALLFCPSYFGWFCSRPRIRSQMDLFMILDRFSEEYAFLASSSMVPASRAR